MFALSETCALNDIDPRADLNDALAHIADYKTARIDELLPWSAADKLRSPASPPTPTPDRASQNRHPASGARAWTNGRRELLTT